MMSESKRQKMHKKQKKVKSFAAAYQRVKEVACMSDDCKKEDRRNLFLEKLKKHA